jgi:hypothetical protein
MIHKYNSFLITNKIILSFFSVPVHNPEYVLAFVIRDVGAALIIYCVAIAKQVPPEKAEPPASPNAKQIPAHALSIRVGVLRLPNKFRGSAPWVRFSGNKKPPK